MLLQVCCLRTYPDLNVGQSPLQPENINTSKPPEHQTTIRRNLPVNSLRLQKPRWVLVPRLVYTYMPVLYGHHSEKTEHQPQVGVVAINPVPVVSCTGKIEFSHSYHRNNESIRRRSSTETGMTIVRMLSVVSTVLNVGGFWGLKQVYTYFYSRDEGLGTPPQDDRVTQTSWGKSNTMKKLVCWTQSHYVLTGYKHWTQIYPSTLVNTETAP